MWFLNLFLPTGWKKQRFQVPDVRSLPRLPWYYSMKISKHSGIGGFCFQGKFVSCLSLIQTSSSLRKLTLTPTIQHEMSMKSWNTVSPHAVKLKHLPDGIFCLSDYRSDRYPDCMWYHDTAVQVHLQSILWWCIELKGECFSCLLLVMMWHCCNINKILWSAFGEGAKMLLPQWSD